MEGKHNSFLFKIDENNNLIKIPHRINKKYETINRMYQLTCFCGDLSINEDCDKYCSSFSDLGWNYETPDGVE